MLRFLSFVYVVICISCNKDSAPNPKLDDYYIKAKINGEDIRFSSNAFGRIEVNSIHGYSFKQTTNNFPSFSFDIESNTTIQPNTRYNEVTTNLIFRYSLTGMETFHSQMGDEMDFEFIITEIKNEFFKGSFSGTIRNASNAGYSLQVSEGEFVLKR